MHDAHSDVSRRDFLRRSAATGAAIALGASATPAAEPVKTEGLPTRVLGRTKRRVTILGLGTAPVGEGPVDTQEAAKIYGEAIDRGVNYVDTAYIYGNAEEALGLLLPKRRDKLFLVTKVWTDGAKRAEEMLTTSLRRMKVDHVDLVHIHHIGGKDVDKVRGEEGVLGYLLKQKEKGTLRHIGLSGHCRPPRFLEMLKTGLIDVVMPVMNYADVNIYDFEGKVLPECRKQNVGVVAMKVYVGIKGGFRNHKAGHVGCVTPKEKLPLAMAYALDLPGVSSAIIGPYTREQAIENVEIAKGYRPLTEEQRRELLAEGKTIAARIGPRYGPIDDAPRSARRRG